MVSVALLFLTSTQAAPGWTADLASTAIEVETDGPGEGRLAAFLVEDVQDEPVNVAPGFVMHAKHLQVESDRVNLSVQGPVSFRSEPYTQKDGYEDVTVRGVENRPQHLLRIFATSEDTRVVSQDAGCGSLEPPLPVTLERDPQVQPHRDPDQVPLQQALSWEECSGHAATTIKGSFLLRLWEWDATLTGLQGPVTLQNGHQKSGPTTPYASTGSAVEHYLYAEDATIHFPSHLEHARLYVYDASIASETITMAAANGHIDGERSLRLEGEAVEIHGQMGAYIQRGSEAATLDVSLAGDMDQVTVDGRSVVFQQTSESQSMMYWILGASVLSVIIAWYLGNRLNYALMHRAGRTVASLAPRDRHEQAGAVQALAAQRAADRGHHRRSRFHARRAMRLFPRLPEATMHWLLAEAMLGRPARAEQALHVQMEGQPAPEQAAMALGVAAALGLLGEPWRSKPWLEHASRQDALLTESAIQGHLLDSLESEDWFRALRNYSDHISGICGCEDALQQSPARGAGPASRRHATRGD